MRLPESCLDHLSFILPTFILHSLRVVASSAPLSVDFGTAFLGDDGQWSAATIRVGSDTQYLSVLPATTGQETRVIGPAGCDDTLTCRSLRGGIYSSNTSTTWDGLGYFDTGYSALAGTTGFADYGLDTIAFTDTVSVGNQTIAIVNSTGTFLGQLGLGVQETRFDSNNTDYPTVLSSLVQQEDGIPSHSYGYTAGAYYRLKSVPGSLTLGGVDTNKFVGNDVTFVLSQGYVPILAINSISVQSTPAFSSSTTLPHWNANPFTLQDISQAALYTIDTSTPFMWLPRQVCDNFANALNLTYNDTLQLYTFSEDYSPDALALWGLNFTFTLADQPSSATTIDLKLPFNAFNLQLSYPFPGLNATASTPPIRYFPLRRANSPQQYTIGRAFLQETYLTVDYERNNFSISQTVFSDAVQSPQLKAIERPPQSQWPGPPNSGTTSGATTSGMSTSAKAGIGAGIGVAVVILLCLVAWYCCIARRLRLRATSSEDPNNKKFGMLGLFRRQRHASKSGISELLGDKRHPTEMISDSSNTRFELAGDTAVEMSAGEVSPAFFSANGSAISRNDPRSPVEIASTRNRRRSTSKDELVNEVHLDRSSSPVPAYSVEDNTQQHGSDPADPYHNHQGHSSGTTSPADQGISPIEWGNGINTVSNGSKNNPSPISPFATQFAISPTSNSTSTGGSGNSRSVRGTGPGSSDSRQPKFLSPTPEDQPAPSRSPSRSSRFREELVEEEQTVATADVAVPRPHVNSRRPSGRKRFSWEQE